MRRPIRAIVQQPLPLPPSNPHVRTITCDRRNAYRLCRLFLAHQWSFEIGFSNITNSYHVTFSKRITDAEIKRLSRITFISPMEYGS